MYVCICNNVTDHQIRQAVSAGARNMRELQLQLGVASTCGCCAPCARELLMDYLQQVRRENTRVPPHTPALATVS